MKLVAVSQMKAIEKEADAHGLTYDQMMENASQGLAEVIQDLPIEEDAVKSSAWSARAIMAAIPQSPHMCLRAYVPSARCRQRKIKDKTPRSPCTLPSRTGMPPLLAARTVW